MDEMVYFYPDGHEAHFEIGHPERPERVETIRSALQNADLWDAYPKLHLLIYLMKIFAQKSIHQLT